MAKNKDTSKKNNITNKKVEEETEPTVTIPISELDKYRTTTIVQESKEEIKKWAKSWIAILAIIFGCLGFFGFPAITFLAFQKHFKEEISGLKYTNAEAKEEMMRATFTAGEARAKMIEATKEAEESRNKMEKATELTKASTDMMREASIMAEEYTDEIMELKEEADMVGSELDLLNSKITLATDPARIKVISRQVIGKKLDDVTNLVSLLAGDLTRNQMRDGAVNLTHMANDSEYYDDPLIAGIGDKQYSEIIDSLNIAKNENEIESEAKQKEFEENSLYKVTIIYDHLPAETNPLLEAITDLMKNEGYLPISYSDVKYNDVYVQKFKDAFFDNIKPNHVMLIGNETTSVKITSLVNLIKKELSIKADMHKKKQIGPRGQVINKNLILVYIPSI